jgi:hypothetical protein
MHTLSSAAQPGSLPSPADCDKLNKPYALQNNATNP